MNFSQWVDNCRSRSSHLFALLPEDGIPEARSNGRIPFIRECAIFEDAEDGALHPITDSTGSQVFAAVRNYGPEIPRRTDVEFQYYRLEKLDSGWAIVCQWR